ASDNIPGVKGIGEAGAIALLNQFGTVESIYEHFDEVPKRYQKPLDGQLEIAKFSKHLATIHCEVPVTLDLVAARVRDYDRSAVIALFQELEFGATMVKRLPASSSGLEVASVPAAPTADTTVNTHTVDLGGGNQQLAMFDLDTVAPTKPLPVAESVSNGAYRAVQTEDDLRELLDEMNAAPAFAFDTETSGLRPLQDELVGMSFSASSGRSWYVPIGHKTDEAQLPRDTVLQAVRPLFSDPDRRRYAHNAKFDVEVLEHAGVPVASIEFDTMLAAALLDKRRGLKELAFYELKLPEPMTALEDLIGRGKKQITFGEVPIEAATGYAAADADMTLRLVHALEPQIRAVPEIADVFYQIEMPLLPILVRMEQAGIGMDPEYMRELGQRMGERLAETEQQIYAIAKRSFNINSGDQLSDVLFNVLQLPTTGLSKTSTGRYSLTADALDGLREHDSSGILELILQFRQLSKLKSTYVDALPQMVNPETGRVHTTYSQLGAATGRLSCLPAGTLVNTQNGLVGIETVQPGELIRTPFGPR
ncbi:MAG TPA: DNA polymerase, partial [Roseiflexaceae bacterium]|nr:DNA polymerase [Roseiflexaceae bacterium]